MNSILQGTTPNLKISISTDDFLVSDVTKLEFAMKHNGTTAFHGLDEVTLDTEDKVSVLVD